MSYTIYDIAKKAGVSIATVSRVFSNSSKVSKATREKVLKIAKEAGYHPQGFAQGLASHKKKKMIMAIVPVLSNYFFMEVLAGVQDKVSEYDYELHIYNIKPGESQVDQIKQLLRRKWAAGYLLISVHLKDDQWKHFLGYDEPITLVDDSFSELDSIYVDNVKGAMQATEFLIESGYRNPAMILPNRDSKPGLDREKGFVKALEKHGLEVNPKNVIKGDSLYREGYNEQNGYEAIKKILKGSTLPDACFCSSDIQAVGAMGALREANVELPIIGYDDIKISEFLGLTTIRQPMYDMGQLAVEHIMNCIKKGSSERFERVFPTELVVRSSTKEKIINKQLQ